MSSSNKPSIGPIGAITFSSLLSLLVAAALPSVVELRRASGEAKLEAERTRFANAIGAIHARWVLSGGSARSLQVGERIVQLSEHGWPTLDPRYPEQDTARELYALLVAEVRALDGWTTDEEPQEGAGIATFRLPTPGGGSFHYEAAIGRIVSRSR